MLGMPEVTIKRIEYAVVKKKIQKCRFVTKETLENYYKSTVEKYLADTHPCRKVVFEWGDSVHVRYAVPISDDVLEERVARRIHTEPLRVVILTNGRDLSLIPNAD